MKAQASDREAVVSRDTVQRRVRREPQRQHREPSADPADQDPGEEAGAHARAERGARFTEVFEGEPLHRGHHGGGKALAQRLAASRSGHRTGSKFGGGNVLLAMVGPQVVPGTYTDLRDHYGLLRTLEDGFGIGTHANNAATADPITGDVWS